MPKKTIRTPAVEKAVSVQSVSRLVPAEDPLEQIIKRYVEDYLSKNKAARTVANGLRVIGIGFRPIIDNLSFRTLNVDQRAQEFLLQGYQEDVKLGVVEHEHDWSKVYRKPGYPALVIEQAHRGARGTKSVIPVWVKSFGDQTLHHVTIQVADIEQAIFFLEKQGIAFAGKIEGKRGTDLRQIFTQPEMMNGQAFSTLELAERHHGYAGFIPS